MILEDSASGGRAVAEARITSIIAHSKGFACAGRTGTVHLYEKTDDRDYYRKVRVVKVCVTGLH